MGSIIIRNIPDDVLESFRQRAKAAGKSAEQLAREAIAEKARPSKDEIIRRMDELRAQVKPVDMETMVQIMREARDERDSGPDASRVDDDR
jgi:plasmid stability protein